MIKKLEKLFTETKMTWRLVLIFSVACGLIPGLLMIPAPLLGTSLQQPGISYEFWVLAALFIILNCEKPVEAGLKTFVFFLISQPLIYLVQVPFSAMGWGLFSYYPRWGIQTLCTLPGGMLAWYVKKGNIWSVLIFSVANLILCLELPWMVHQMLYAFPKLLLSCVFILAEIVFLTGLLFKKRRMRTLAFILAAIMVLAGIWTQWKSTNPKGETHITEIEGEAPFTVLSEYENIDISVRDRYLSVTVGWDTDIPIQLQDADGNIITVRFICHDGIAEWEQE